MKNMFLDAISLEDDALPDRYPFTVPVVQVLTELRFLNPVTLFVGENGSGKSTLLEAIACGLACPAVGRADVRQDPMLAAANLLAKRLRFVRRQNAKIKMFFRAEDAIGFTQRVSQDLAELKAMEQEYDRTLSGEGRDRAMGAMRGQQDGLISRYGEDPDAHSHGEWFINMLRERLHSPGLYLLDEPETPLSPIHQLTLLSMIKSLTEAGAQFIIATHSPMLMACPGAMIYQFDDTGISETNWEDVEHVAILKAFLADPEAYLRHL